MVKTQVLDHFDNVPDAFLSTYLFTGDDGLEDPNPTNAYLNDGSFSFDHKLAGGFAYKWAQTLCGYAFPVCTSILKLTTNGTHIVEANQPATPFFSKLIQLIAEKRSQLVKLNTLIAAMLVKVTLPNVAGHKITGKILPLRRLETTVDSQSFRFRASVSGTSTVM